ncbi:hypothetical protein [Leeuwenhoekiella parthenopeia]|uniref:Uncharacterized protein n=1 Tax=Leeuwenhoekiella parthenopeia TaxID=2890320 RepID=A0ABS8GXC3_9FLAO|nr:hypothetical protein [Leeuwenhoekiella parthenopeia]MCC4214654.1 hypothetical protein [Leeuwenhoekiella parthenopeia]
MKSILHFSPLRKSPEVLELHLSSLENLSTEGCNVTFSFFDDNSDPESSRIFQKYLSRNANWKEFKFDLGEIDNINPDKRWSLPLYNRITKIKDAAIAYFLKNNYDYLFFTDADLIIHPKTLKCLISQNKDFCSEIFWTQFNGSNIYSPNAWYAKHRGFDKQDLLVLAQKGTHSVDFTGACTLLSRDILHAGVRFQRISNIEYLGEDKHFCIRAAVMGYEAFCNSDFPAFHIYNESYLQFARNILKTNWTLNYTDKWLDDHWVSSLDRAFRKSKMSKFKGFVKKLIS